MNDEGSAEGRHNDSVREVVFERKLAFDRADGVDVLRYDKVTADTRRDAGVASEKQTATDKPHLHGCCAGDLIIMHEVVDVAEAEFINFVGDLVLWLATVLATAADVLFRHIRCGERGHNGQFSNWRGAASRDDRTRIDTRVPFSQVRRRGHHVGTGVAGDQDFGDLAGAYIWGAVVKRYGWEYR